MESENSLPIEVEKNPIIIDEYLQNNKTRVLIGVYQKIWRNNNEKLVTAKKLESYSNIAYVIKHVIKPIPSEILADKDALAIVNQILKDPTYAATHRSAEILTKKKKEKEARAEWSKCHFRVAEICAEQLKLKDVHLDIREQENEPFYDPTFDIKKADNINEFLLLNNKEINSPLWVVPYMKAGFIIAAMEHQKAEPILFNCYERFLLFAKTKTL